MTKATLSIQRKLFLALLAANLLIVGTMIVLMQWSMGRGMIEYVNTREVARHQVLVEQLTVSYSQHGDWQFLQDNRRLWDQLRRTPFRRDARHPAERPPPPARFPGRPPPGGRPGLSVLDTEKQPVVGRYSADNKFNELPIRVNDQLVGWLAIPHRDRLIDDFDLKFAAQQNVALMLIGALVVCIAGLSAWLLARHFLSPIQQLAQTTSELTQGNYAIEVSITRSDELGQLARDFNELARTLKANETARSRWLADMSHELRTPLSIMRAEIEAIRDGIRPLSTRALQSLQEETIQLQTLVEDLHELGNADMGALHYHKQWLNLDTFIRDAVERHAALLETAGIELQIDMTDAPVRCYADAARLNQLMDNLLTNSRKYTDTGGKIRVSLRKDREGLTLAVDDSAPAVPDEALLKLFDHLYRVEGSRNRATGGSGIGLAMCQRIVEAHGGTIEAGRSTLGGLLITIYLPLDKTDLA